jgi:hypothetical protein
LIPERVEELADAVLQAALKLAHLEKSAYLAIAAQESLSQMSPLTIIAGQYSYGGRLDLKVYPENIESIKRAMKETCDQLEIEKSKAHKEYNDAVAKFKSFVASLKDTKV